MTHKRASLQNILPIYSHLNHGQTCLQVGDWEAAWSDYKARMTKGPSLSTPSSSSTLDKANGGQLSVTWEKPAQPFAELQASALAAAAQATKVLELEEQLKKTKDALVKVL